MNPYLIIGIMIGFIAWTGVAAYDGYKQGEAEMKLTCDKHDEAQQALTINAENGVIKTERNAASINTNEVQAYEKDAAIIDHDYYIGLMQPGTASAGNGMPAVSATPAGVSAAKCQAASKKYKLSFKQCDTEEAGYRHLWDDWNSQAQAANKK